MRAKASKSDHVCKYCEKGFSSERTLSNHMCVKKQRFLDKDSVGSRLGFRAFQIFYEVSTNAKNPKTIEDFINSTYYLSFVKFGRYLATLDPLDSENFIKYLCLNSVKLKDWIKESVYYEYVVDYVRKEGVERALERSILYIADWCDDKSIPIQDFFKVLSTFEATLILQRGRISPWVLYSANSAGDLLESFNEEQIKMIGNLIDPTFWKSKFTRMPEDFEFAVSVMDDAGL